MCKDERRLSKDKRMYNPPSEPCRKMMVIDTIKLPLEPSQKIDGDKTTIRAMLENDGILSNKVKDHQPTIRPMSENDGV